MNGASSGDFDLLRTVAGAVDQAARTADSKYQPEASIFADAALMAS
ncbi:hypothetical protein [Burkholderia stagnalis]|nr:hypothetical protein [Burkholderia stagnalis]